MRNCSEEIILDEHILKDMIMKILYSKRDSNLIILHNLELSDDSDIKISLMYPHTIEINGKEIKAPTRLYFGLENDVNPDYAFDIMYNVYKNIEYVDTDNAYLSLKDFYNLIEDKVVELYKDYQSPIVINNEEDFEALLLFKHNLKSK